MNFGGIWIPLVVWQQKLAQPFVRRALLVCVVQMLVRGVMGYEGHLMMVDGDDKRKQGVAKSMSLLVQAAQDVGGEIISAGGTGTWDMHDSTIIR